MKKRVIILAMLLAFILLFLINNINAIYVTGKSVTDKSITGEITGEATTQLLGMNISVLGPPNTAPRIEYISPEIFVCENDFLEYLFNATDDEGDPLTYDLFPKSPSVPFRIMFSSIINSTTREYLIYTGTLNKVYAGGSGTGYKTYEENVSVSDSEYVDSKLTNITIIEINNAPDVNNIGVQTVWTNGPNSTFYKQVEVDDVENGDQNSGNFTFKIKITNSTGNLVNLFNITSNGIMNFTPNSSHIGIYNITLNITDLGLSNPYPNISFCNEDGNNKTSNITFSLTITDSNRPPTINSYFPLNKTLNIPGNAQLYFNISDSDPEGTIPDTYWYVDDVFKEYDPGSSFDEFNHTFGCGVYGIHTVKVEITDGLLNATLQWNLTVELVPCSPPGGGGGGGGGGAGIIKETCIPNWSCSEWEQCRNLEESYKNGEISLANRLFIKLKCSLTNWDSEFCGYQTRECIDLNYCDQEITITTKEQAPEEKETSNVTIGEVSGNVTQEEINELPEIEKPGGESCISNFSCSDWSKCRITYNLNDVSEKEISLDGEQYRDCSDLNFCEYDKTEKRICTTKNPIIAKALKDYVEIYDEEEETLVSRLKLTEKSLSIQIPLDGSEYQPYCFDGIKNYDEDEIDCIYERVGNCPTCITEFPSLRGDYFIMIIIMITLISSCSFLTGWYLYLGKKIKKSKNKILRISSLRKNRKNIKSLVKARLLTLGIIFGISLIFLVYANYSLKITGEAIINEDSIIYVTKNSSNATTVTTIQECYYTEFPDCSDKIKNCHDGDCETQIDCGGPCEPCPETCSDGIRNQGEEGIDCGGPCYYPCYEEIPTVAIRASLMYTFLIILILILILIARLVIKNYTEKRELSRVPKRIG